MKSPNNNAEVQSMKFSYIECFSIQITFGVKDHHSIFSFLKVKTAKTKHQD